MWQLEREGVETGVDLDALVETARWLAGVLGRELDGYVHRCRRRFPLSGRPVDEKLQFCALLSQTC